MGSVAAAWRTFSRAYIGNAAAQRDQRIQLRGARSLLVWTIYLLLFCILGASIFSSSVRQEGAISVTAMQQDLKNFYSIMVGVLGGGIALIAPALGASAIVTERQKRLLDLVFSSPVTPRYYLIGKLISSYRYIWMLLILSLPVIAVGVVMGGATWSDVAWTYVTLSLDGLVLAAIGIGLSSGAQKVASAVTYTYIFCGLFLMFSTAIGTASVASRYMGRSNEMPVIGMLSPFLAASTTGTFTSINGTNVSNTLLNIPLCLGLVFMLLLGAGSALGTRPTKETVRFRLLGLLLIGITSYYIQNGSSFGFETIVFQSMLLGTIAFAIPLYSCYVNQDPFKFQYDGMPKLKTVFAGVPSGSLAYTMAIVAVSAVGAFLGFHPVTSGFPGMGTSYYNRFDQMDLALFYGWATATFFFAWAVARVSSLSSASLAVKRALTTVGVVMVFVALQVIIAVMSFNADFATTYSPFAPLYESATNRQPATVTWAAIFLIAGTGLFALEATINKSRRRKLDESRV